MAMKASATPKKSPWRGRKRVADPKDKFVAVRCTSADYEIIGASAERAGLAVGPFLRAVALGSPGPRAVPPAGGREGDAGAAARRDRQAWQQHQPDRAHRQYGARFAAWARAALDAGGHRGDAGGGDEGARPW